MIETKEPETVVAVAHEDAPEQRRGRGGRIVIYVVLSIVALLWAVPLLWAIATSFKPEIETTTIPLSWIPSKFTLDAYMSVLQTGDLGRWYFNSTFTSLLITLLTIGLSSLAAFAFSRVDFWSKNFFFWLILAGIMVPSQVLIIPLFSQMQAMGLVNTYWGIILPQIASPVSLFIFKQFFDGLPNELEEAALLDGASRFRIYWQIWMPLAGSAIAAVGIFAFVSAWNNFIWPFIIVTSTDMMTVPVGLATVQTSYGIRYAQIMAWAIVGGLPALIVFLLFQRQIVQGIAGTGLKG